MESLAAKPNPKKRVLIVDDEEVLLDIYKLVFEGDDEWELSLASNGIDALAIIDEAPVDVLVCDMRMPGMSGAELVQEVMRRHPKTSRLIMSGLSDLEHVSQCLGATHQFLAKPCELGVLRATISRVCALDSCLMDERLIGLVAQLRSLPSLPSLYFQIIEALSDPETSLDRVAGIVSQDPAMTAKILQLVNSAFFGVARRISNPADAVQHLGFDRVRSLVLSLHVFSCFEQVQAGGFSFDGVWKHSMATGAVAQKIARLEKADPAVVDESYVGGMLHDIGKVMLAASLPEQYGKAVALARERKVPLAEAEREIFGVSHPQVGAYLLGLWGLPITMVEAVAFHHDPARCGLEGFSALTAVHVASFLENEIHPADGVTPSALDATYLAGLGVEDRLEDWRAAAAAILSGGQ